MASGEGLGGILPEESLAIASALADRMVRDQLIGESISAQVLGEPIVEKSQEELRTAHLGRATLILLQVEDPSRTLSLTELLEAGSGATSYERQAAKLNEGHTVPGLHFTADHVHEAGAALVNEVQAGSTMSDAYITDYFARQLEASRQVAEERDISPAAVYEDDDLYYAVARAIEDPQTAATHMKSVLDAFSPEAVDRVILQMLDTIITPELRAGLSDEEVQGMIMEMQIDPGIQALLTAQYELRREAIRQRALYDLIRIHTLDAVRQLSPELKDTLLPQRQLARELVELVGTDDPAVLR